MRFSFLAAALVSVGTTFTHSVANATTTVSAQQSLSGSVRDARTSQPIPDAIVQLVEARRIVASGQDGSWSFDNVANGTYSIRARRLGYEEIVISVRTDTMRGRSIDIRLVEVASVVAPVVVSATRERQLRTESSATIDVLDGGSMRLARASHPAQVMKRISGVYVTQLSGEGHSMAIRQPISTKPMYLYLEDGVPTRATGFFNHNALYEVNLPQSGGMEVLKGPGTALYGSDAVGGVINAITRGAPLTPQVEASIEGGSYGWQRAMISGGTSTANHGIRADLNLTKMEGWRSAAPYDRQSGTLRWDARLSEALSARTVVTASDIDQVDVFAQSDAQFQKRDPINRSPIASRHVEALRWSTAIEHSTAYRALSITPFARRNVLNLLPFWQLTYDPQIWETYNTSLGVLVRARQDFDHWRTRVVAGADIDRSPGTFVAKQAVLGTTGEGAARTFSTYTVGNTQYDYAVTYMQASPYVHVETSPLSPLRFDLGARYDVMSYDYTTNLEPIATGSHRVPESQKRSYSRLSPKVGVTWDVSPSVNAYASYRTGFRTPSHSNLFQQNTALNSTELSPVTVTSMETGLRGQYESKIVWSGSVYHMALTNDIITYVTPLNTREAKNAGKTRHAGVEGSVGVRLANTVRLDLSAAYSKHTYVEWVPQAAREGVAEVRYDGNVMEQAPSTLGNALATWTPSFMNGGRLAVEWSHTGGYETDPANQGPRYGGHGIVTLHGNGYVTPRVELFARAVNVTDRNYAEAVSFDRFQGLQYTPGNPRSLFVGLRINAER